VGLGGSAGSLKTLQQFFEGLPVDSGFVFVVIVHLSPEHDSAMAEILQRATTMSVVQVRALTKVEPDHIYVIPPAQHLSMTEHHLSLSPVGHERARRMPIDLFFRTLAETHGSQATAVVLSGSDADDAIGLKRIKERGGLTLAQDPEEADFKGM